MSSHYTAGGMRLAFTQEDFLFIIKTLNFKKKLYFMSNGQLK